MLSKKIVALPLVLLMVFVGLAQPARNIVKAAPSGNFAVAISADAVTLDPARADPYDNVSLLITSQIYETLVNYAPGDGQPPQPDLAQSWSTSSDGLTWTFTIRPGVKFQDGTDLDANAILFNFQTWWDPANLYHTGSYPAFGDFIGFKGPDSLITSLGVTSTQFIIVLSHPAGILGILEMPSFGIASPAAIQAGNLANHPVGSGPFQFGQWVAGSEIRLDPYPNHLGSAPLSTSLTFKVLATSADQLAALQSNAVQSAGDISGADLTTALSDPDLSVQWRPSTAVGYLGINQARTPFDNLLVRQAIAHAINKAALVASQYGPGTQAAAQFLTPSIWGYDPGLTDTSYDPTLAKSLLAQANYPTGFSTTLTYSHLSRSYLPNPGGTATQIAGYLSAVGINVSVKEELWSDFLSDVRNGNLDLYLLGWGAGYLHPDDFFTYHFCNPSNKQFSATPDATLCSLVGLGLTLPTLAQQLADYRSASDRVYNTLPLVPLVYPRTPLVINRNLGGVTPSPLGIEAYQFAFTVQNRVYLPITMR